MSEREIRAASGKDLESSHFLTSTEASRQVPARKSFAVRLTFRSASGTLGEGDVERLVQRSPGAWQHALGRRSATSSAWERSDQD